MNKQILAQLTNIYNTLSLIETKGNNTLLMASCLTEISNLCQFLTQQEAIVSPLSTTENENIEEE